MEKNSVIELIKKEKLIVIIRESDKEVAKKIIDKVIVAGIKIVEITMNSDSPFELIEYIRQKKSNIIIGVGTVLDSKTLKRVLKNNVDFVVSPILDTKLIKICKRNDILFIPGVATLNEIYNGWKNGIRIFKLFPSSIYEPSIIKTYKSVINDIEIMPTGGINLENTDVWLKGGAIALGIGGFISKEAKKENNFEKVEEITIRLKDKVDFFLQ